ncbi:MAG TPA: GNAT family N-acetyltransferase [Polyangiaceae bacterium]|nr:GNAT family N-acetyltransferase [Polyangiaceae bacterium]
MDSSIELNAAIVTARLSLEPLRGWHGAQLFEGLSEPRLYRWNSGQPPESVEALQQRWERFAAHPFVSVGRLLTWAARRTSDGSYIGKLDVVIGEHNVATNVGYLFFLPFWNQGYATEAVLALAVHLEHCGIVEQRALVTVGNDASARVLQKARFEKTRVLPENETIRGKRYDEVEYVRRVE